MKAVQIMPGGKFHLWTGWKSRLGFARTACGHDFLEERLKPGTVLPLHCVTCKRCEKRAVALEDSKKRGEN